MGQSTSNNTRKSTTTTDVFLADYCCDYDSVTSERAPKPNVGAPLAQATSRRDDPWRPSDGNPKSVPRPFSTIGVRFPVEGRAVPDAAKSGTRFPRQVGERECFLSHSGDDRSTARGQSGR